MRTYDATLIFLTTTTEDNIEKALGRIREEVGRLGGSIDREEALGRRAFARTLKKQDAGYYFKLTLKLAPETVDALLARFRLIDTIFRVQVVHAKPEAAVEETAAPVAEAAPEAEADDVKGGSDG